MVYRGGVEEADDDQCGVGEYGRLVWYTEEERRCSPRCVPGREDRPGAICLGGRVWTQPVGTLLLPTTTLQTYNWDESGEMVPLRPKLHCQTDTQEKRGNRNYSIYAN